MNVWVQMSEELNMVLGLRQARLDKHDAELCSQRQLLEDLRSEISLLRKSGVDFGKQHCDNSSDSASTVSSFTPGGMEPKDSDCAGLGSLWFSRFAEN